MTIIAHISDLHLIEENHKKRNIFSRKKLSLISFAVALNAEERMERVSNILDLAYHSGAEHVVITGDLTEDGMDLQFDVLANVLLSSKFTPEQVTLVPGNHDGYTSSDAFELALFGPLYKFQGTSSFDSVTTLKDVTIVPISTVIKNQAFIHSQGVISKDALIKIKKTIIGKPGEAIIVAQHHPPSHHKALFEFFGFDGVKNAMAMHEIIVENKNVNILHGHNHKKTTKSYVGRQHAQVFSVSSMRDDALSLRVYEVTDGIVQDHVNFNSSLF